MYISNRKNRNRKIAFLTFVMVTVLFIAAGIHFVYQSHKYAATTSVPSQTDELLLPNTTATFEDRLPTAQIKIPNDYVIPPIKNGLAPLLSTIPTKEKVVFLGIDDGANKKDFELQMMKDNNIKASLFLANRFIKDNPSFFSDFVTAGSLIENHTINHKLLSNLSYEDQKVEICGEADLQLKQFGRKPILFRPPGGSYNQDTQRAAADCGMKAVVLWIAKANGGAMQYQVGHTLRAGDIVLMHFRPEFAKDMQAFIDAENAAGLHTELLENWL